MIIVIFIIPTVVSCNYLLPLALQDAEHFEAKRARREGGAAPAWASARVEAKRAQQAQQPNELDEDDAFEARQGRWLPCPRALST